MRDIPSEVTIVEPGRALLMWENAAVVHMGNAKMRLVFLCSDVFYVAKYSLLGKVWCGLSFSRVHARPCWIASPTLEVSLRKLDA